MYDLQFTLIGNYVSITDFIYDIENDEQLKFEIKNFSILTQANATATTNKTNTVTNTTTNTNTNKNNTTAMPNTGVDYSVVFIIAICGISAIYAYKKISDYKNF